MAKCWNRTINVSKNLGHLVLEILESFCKHMQYGHISTIPTQSTNSLIVQVSDEGGHLHAGPGKRVVEIVHQKAY